jgi:uncharacterized alkaline shock family protein YloU
VPAAPAAVVEGVDVDALAAAVRACPAVTDLSPGPFGAVATYLPGRRVTGIAIRTPAAGGPVEVEVHVVAAYGPTMATVAGQVHAVIAAQVPAATATVAIDDIATPS